MLREEEEGRVVGLDLSLTGTGVCALARNGQVLHSLLIGYGLKRSASVRDKIERMLYIAKGIVKVVDECVLLKPSDSEGKGDLSVTPLVGIEGYAFGKRGNATIDLGELGGVVKSQLWLRFGIEPTILAPSTCRKAVFGSGNTKKDDVIPLLRSRGLEFTSQDIADAYVVAEALRLRATPCRTRRRR